MLNLENKVLNLPENLLSFYFPNRKKYTIDTNILIQYRHLFNTSLILK